MMKYDELIERLQNDRGLRRAGKLTGHYVWATFRFITLFCLSIIVLFPLLYMISISLRPSVDLNDPLVVWIPTRITFQNIVDSFHVMNYVESVKNTFVISLVCSVLSVVSCSLAGYGLSRFNVPLKKLWMALMLIMIIVPPQNTLIAIYLHYNEFDMFGIGSLIGLFTGKPWTVTLIGSFWSLYLPAMLGAGIRSGLFVLIFSKFFTNIPPELEDAASIDGCGAYRTFVSVMLPNAAASLLTVFLFSFIWYWQDYFFTSMFIPETSTLSLQLSRLSASLAQALNPVGSAGALDINEVTVRLQAGCLLAIAPLVILYAFLQRFFVGGIERTGIVG